MASIIRNAFVWKNYLTGVFLSASLSSVHAQPLTGRITYAELMHNADTVTVEWPSREKTENLRIILLPLPADRTRIEQTTAFVQRNYNITSPYLTPRLVVIHSMDLGGLQPSLEASSFLHDHMPTQWGALAKAGSLPNGAHFIVAPDGTIYCLSPPRNDRGAISFDKDNHRWLVMRHQDGNPLAIGIENLTPENGRFDDLTGQQIHANASLLRWLRWLEDHDLSITSHHQYNRETFLDSVLALGGLRHMQKSFRTTGRKDVGDEVLKAIIAAAAR